MPRLDETANGVYIIAITPFTDTGAIDYASTDRLIEFYLERGATGLTVLGMMGEAPKLSGAEAIAAANGNGIPVVDYDHLTSNGGAQYFVGVKGTPDCASRTPETAKAEAEALASLVAALTSADPTTADTLAVDMTTDAEAGYDVPSLLVTP